MGCISGVSFSTLWQKPNHSHEPIFYASLSSKPSFELKPNVFDTPPAQGCPTGQTPVVVKEVRHYFKGLTDAHFEKIEEILGFERGKSFINEIEDNPNINNVGSVEDLGILVKTKKWRLKPNDAYTSNGYAYKTDEYGRIESVEGDLKLDGVERHPDGPNVGEGDGKLPNDVGEHLIGRQYGGAGDATNVVAMEKTVNEYSNVGKFGRHEIRWRRLLNENPLANIQLKITVVYNSNNFTIRPDAFVVEEVINGTSANFTIPNY